MSYRCKYRLSDKVVLGGTVGAPAGHFDDASHGTTIAFTGVLPREHEKIYDDTPAAEKLDSNPNYGAYLVLTTPATDTDGDGLPDIAADNVATAAVNIQKKDKDGVDMVSVSDNETVFLEVSGGALDKASVALVNGAASFMLKEGTSLGCVVSIGAKFPDFGVGSVKIKYR